MLIEWSTHRDYTIDTSGEHEDELLIALLKTADNKRPWKGCISVKRKRMQVSLANMVGGASVVVVIAEPLGVRHRPVNPDDLITISMSGKTTLSLEAMNQLTLAIQEGINVYKNALAQDKAKGK